MSQPPEFPSHVAPAPPLLEARGVSKAFPGVQALDQAGIVVRAGRLNALLGENGAGKSTLMSILSGVFPADEGEIRIDGDLCRWHGPRDAQAAGVATIFQELNLAPNLTAAENIFLGREPRTRLGLVDYRRMNADARRLMERLDSPLDVAVPIERLQVGAQQMVEIAKALALEARVLILDEPTSALSEQESATLFRVLDQLKRRGVGMIYITHRLDELPRLADDVTVMRDGRLIAERPFQPGQRDELVALMVGRELGSLTARGTTASVDAPPVLEVRGLSVANPLRPDSRAVENASLSVRRGEVVGLFGLMGAGRTELLQAIFGVRPRATTGEIRVAGRPVRFRTPAEAIAAGVILAPEDRKRDGLVLSLSVAENVGLAAPRRIEHCGLVCRKRRGALAQEFVRRLRIKAASLAEPVQNLSGGNQQKVLLAKGLAAEPKVLLIDEPTRGVDVGAKREIYALIDEWARAGLAVLVASSEMPEVLALCDRIIVMNEGRLVAQFTRDAASEEALLHAALPVRRRDAVASDEAGGDAA